MLYTEENEIKGRGIKRTVCVRLLMRKRMITTGSCWLELWRFVVVVVFMVASTYMIAHRHTLTVWTIACYIILAFEITHGQCTWKIKPPSTSSSTDWKGSIRLCRIGTVTEPDGGKGLIGLRELGVTEADASAMVDDSEKAIIDTPPFPRRLTIINFLKVLFCL